MQFPDPLLRGRLIRRYKRFLADIELDSGETVTAHCANPGSMMGLAEPGLGAWLSPARNPARKLRYSWEMVATPDGLVGINTALPNRLVEEAISAGRIPELMGYADMRREVPYGKNSRIDLLLTGGNGSTCHVEVKSVTLRRRATDGGGLAEFPDSVTARGTKHLAELTDVVQTGGRAAMLFLVQRQDCTRFAIAEDIDPAYGAALGRARKAGVEMLCYTCTLSPYAIEVSKALPFL